MKNTRGTLLIAAAMSAALILTSCTAAPPAATVNGKVIAESKITNKIAVLRENENLQSDDDWARYLVSQGQTPEAVRQGFLEALIEEQLVRQTAKSEGIKATTAEVDREFNAIRDKYQSDEEWEEALKANGMTETQYRYYMETNILKEKVQAAHHQGPTPTDEQIVEAVSQNSESFDGLKRSSFILFSITDAYTAQQVFSQLKNGSLDFAEAAKQYSEDKESGALGGDIGYRGAMQQSDNYLKALDNLNEGEISSPLIEGDYILIIKCTDVFTDAENITSIDQIPDQIKLQVKSILQEESDKAAYQSWYVDLRQSPGVVVNDMPSGLPYAIDLSTYGVAQDNSLAGLAPQMQTIMNEDGNSSTQLQVG